MLCGLLAGASLLAAGSSRSGFARSRMHALRTAPGSAQVPSAPSQSRPVARGFPARALVVLAVLVALAAVAGDGADAGVVLSAVAAAGALGWLSRRSGSVDRRRRAALAAELPATADLLAMCLRAGAIPSDALDAVAGSTGGPLAERLRQVAGALRVGATPAEAWGVCAADDPLAPMARAFIRSDASGAPVAETLTAVADEGRRVARWTAEAAARRAGVHAVGPLAVCFLPAFVLTGVVPVILAVAAEVLGGLR